MQTKTIDDLQEKGRRFAARLTDVRFAGQALFVVIILLISWSGIKSIQTNYGLQQQISALKQGNDVKQLENANMALQNQYYQSNQYLELAARQNFGLAQPGEKEVLVPQNVALSYTVNVPNDTPSVSGSTGHPSALSQHLHNWLNFFLHRAPAN